MHLSESSMVMPSGVLYSALFGLGVARQAFTQGASLQWLHITGITVCCTLGNLPSVLIRKSAQL
jgi:hypothetical protein